MGTKTKIFIGILLCLSIGFGGFYLGQKSIKIEQSVEFEEGETETGILESPEAKEEETPEAPDLPMKNDTIYLEGEKEYIIQKVDTTKTISEFIKKRKYEETVLDNDTIGRLKIGATVQYNTLQNLEYEFTPYQKVITKEKIKTKSYTLFGGASVNTFGQAGIQLGIRKGKTGYSLKGITDFDKSGIEFGMTFDF